VPSSGGTDGGRPFPSFSLPRQQPMGFRLRPAVCVTMRTGEALPGGAASAARLSATIGSQQQRRRWQFLPLRHAPMLLGGGLWPCQLRRAPLLIANPSSQNQLPLPSFPHLIGLCRLIAAPGGPPINPIAVAFLFDDCFANLNDLFPPPLPG
jgi:hypothetical protein